MARNDATRFEIILGGIRGALGLQSAENAVLPKLVRELHESLVTAKRDWDSELEKRGAVWRGHVREQCDKLLRALNGDKQQQFDSEVFFNVANAIVAKLASVRREAIAAIPTNAEAQVIFDGLGDLLGSHREPADPRQFVDCVARLKTRVSDAEKACDRLVTCLDEQVKSHEEHRKAMAEQAEQFQHQTFAFANLKLKAAADKLAAFADGVGYDLAAQLKRFAENEMRGAL